MGKEVKLYQKNPYTEREEVVTATLLSNNGVRSQINSGDHLSAIPAGSSSGRPGKSHIKAHPCLDA